VTAPAKKPKKEKEWTPPQGSWENDVDYVETVEQVPDPKTGEEKRYAYLVWNNDKKTQHLLSSVYQKCPQKMLQYYESHLCVNPRGRLIVC
jgi:chromobox protein 1